MAEQPKYELTAQAVVIIGALLIALLLSFHGDKIVFQLEHGPRSPIEKLASLPNLLGWTLLRDRLNAGVFSLFFWLFLFGTPALVVYVKLWKPWAERKAMDKLVENEEKLTKLRQGSERRLREKGGE